MHESNNIYTQEDAIDTDEGKVLNNNTGITFAFTSSRSWMPGECYHQIKAKKL